MRESDRSSNLKEYIYYLVTQLRSIIDENGLNLKIEVAPKWAKSMSLHADS